MKNSCVGGVCSFKNIFLFFKGIHYICVISMVGLINLTTLENAKSIDFTSITNWTGPAAGAGINEAAFIIDWGDGHSPIAWGYRWNSAITKTGEDMLLAIDAADTNLTLTISYTAWGLSFDAARYNRGCGNESYEDEPWIVNEKYYKYYINTSSGDYSPNGNPYTTGSWIEAMVGPSTRILHNGSYDIRVWGKSTDSINPTAESASIVDNSTLSCVPEPSSVVLLIFGASILIFLRKRNNS